MLQAGLGAGAVEHVVVIVVVHLSVGQLEETTANAQTSLHASAPPRALALVC